MNKFTIHTLAILTVLGLAAPYVHAAPHGNGMVYDHVDRHGNPVFNTNTNSNANLNGNTNLNGNSNTNTSTSGSTSTSGALSGSTSGATSGTTFTSTETTIIPAPPMQTPQNNPCPVHFVPVWYGQAVGNTIPTCIPIHQSQW